MHWNIALVVCELLSGEVYAVSPVQILDESDRVSPRTYTLEIYTDQPLLPNPPPMSILSVRGGSFAFVQ